MNFLTSVLRVLRLRIDAWVAGGRIEIARSVRLRTRVIFRGRGTLRIGEHAVIGDRDAGMPGRAVFICARGERTWIDIGAGARIGNGVELIALERIAIGEKCMVGAGARIMDADFHGVAPGEREGEGARGAVLIGRGAWIGMGAMILKRVRVGEGAAIGAGAVVSADVEPGSVAAGNPARVISRWATAG